MNTWVCLLTKQTRQLSVALLYSSSSTGPKPKTVQLVCSEITSIQVVFEICLYLAGCTPKEMLMISTFLDLIALMKRRYLSDADLQLMDILICK